MGFINRATSYFKKTFKARRSDSTEVAKESNQRETVLSRIRSLVRPDAVQSEREIEPRHRMIIPNVNCDDESEPISVAALDAICRGEASLDDYSKMRIFLTLFSEDGIADEQREPIWKSLAKI